MRAAPPPADLEPDMPGLAFVPAVVVAEEWLTLLEEFGLASDEWPAATIAYIAYLDATESIYSARVLPLASDTAALMPLFRARDEQAMEIVCGPLLQRAHDTNATLRRVQRSLFEFLRSRADTPDRLRLLDSLELELAFTVHEGLWSECRYLCHLNCDRLARKMLTDYTVESRAKVEEMLADYRRRMMPLLASRELVYVASVCDSTAVLARAHSSDVEWLDAVSRSRKPLLAVERQIAQANSRLVKSLSEIVAPSDADRLGRRFHEVAYPHIYPDPTDLDWIINETARINPEFVDAGLLQAFDSARHERRLVCQSLVGAYETMAWDFTQTLGAGGEYEAYVSRVGSLASKRLAIARQLLLAVKNRLEERPDRTRFDDLLGRAEAQLSKATRFVAYPPQPLIIEMRDGSGVPTILGIQPPEHP